MGMPPMAGFAPPPLLSGAHHRGGRDPSPGRGRRNSSPRSKQNGRGSSGREKRRDSQTSQAVLMSQVKTKLCTFFQEGRCTRGTDCSFAHGDVELRELPDLRKTRLCAAFAEGNCVDRDCNFAHGKHELRHPDPAFKAALAQKRLENSSAPATE